LVASLEHPHIVSIYDYWRDADGAYVVGPYLAGRSLADGKFATMSMAQVIKIASQVGSALSYAHRQGVVHRDVKPANILLDSDGNAYLADFGIAARAVEAATGVQSKSVGYRAPEDRDGDAVDQRSDLYALAAVVARLLVGTPPERLEMSNLDERVRDVLARGLAVDPDDRYNSVDEFLEQFTTRAGGTAVALTPASHRNPYKGLAAFSQHDSPDFFGRTDEIERLVLMVGENRLSAVIGPSGSGKSSLTLAGLLPALAAGAISGSEAWISVRAVPGGYPFDELAIALSALSTEPLSALSTELAADDGKGLLRIAKRTGQELQGELVIVIDQFEELFTLVGDDAVRDQFATALVTAATDPASRLRIVLTLRADFFHQVLTQPVLGPIIGRVHLALAPLDADGIRLAIVEPAARAGLEFEPGLPERIVADLKDQPGSLPLLQFTLDRLAVAATDGFIADDQYTELGGVKGALADRAEGIFQGLTDNQKDAAQQTFTRLLSVSDEAGDVRRRVRMTELESLGLAAADLGAVIDNFGKERLLTFDVDPTTRGATVEVAHEALLREWPTLRTWVDSRRESLVLQRRFQVALGEWEESDRNPSNLLTGGKLSQYEEWAAGQDVTLTAAERGFVDASIERRSGEARGRRARRRRIMAGFAAAAVVALLLAVVAFLQRGQAEDNAALAEANAALAEESAALAEQAAAQAQDNAALAEARELILEAEKNVTIDPELSMLLSLEAIEAFRASGEAPPSAQSVLRRAMALDRVVARVPGGRWVAVSQDGALFATRGEGDTVVIRSIDTMEIVTTMPLPGPNAGPAFFHPSGDWLAVVHEGGSRAVRVWDLRTPGIFFDIGSQVAQNPGTQFSPEGDLIVIQTDTDPTTVEVWSFPDGELRYSSGEDRARGISFSGDGRLAFVGLPEGGPPSLHIVEAATGLELQTIALDVLDVPAEPHFTSFSPDGSRLAIADQRTVAMIDLTNPQEAEWHNDSLRRVFQPVWLPDGERLVVGGEDRVSIIDAATGVVIETVAGHRGGTFSYAAVPGRDWVASGGLNDEETVIFDLGPPLLAEFGVFPSAFPGVLGMDAVGDGSRLAVKNLQSNGVIDANTGDLIELRPGRPDSAANPSYIPVVSANGLYTAGTDPGGGSRLWSNLDGREVFAAPDAEIRGMSEDGTLVVSVDPSTDRTQLVSIAGAVIAELDVVEGQWWAAVFSPDGRYVATNAGAIQIWDTSTGAQLGSIEEYDLGGTSILWNLDGSWLTVGGFDGIIRVFEVGKLMSGVSDRDALVKSITAHDNFMSLVDSKDGSQIMSVAAGEPARVWDLDTGALVAEFVSADGEWIGATFHPSEPRLFAEVDTDVIGIFTLDADELLEIARSRLSRDLTEEECQLYLRGSCDEG
jgi:WD40 repeat protein